FSSEKLSVELLFKLHHMLTDNTDAAKYQNQFRKDRDDITVNGKIHGEELIVHEPPKEKYIEQEIEVLIKYDNDELNIFEVFYIHDSVKACDLQFWIVYVHRFGDGKGRLSRSLFYWYLFKNEYWISMFFPISTCIKISRTQYDMAFNYSEQDGLYLTY